MSVLAAFGEEPRLRWKLGSEGITVPAKRASRTERRLNLGRQHLVLEFQGLITDVDWKRLSRQGVRFLAPVPDHGALVSVPVGIVIEGSTLERTFAMAPERKVSRALYAQRAGARPGFVVEFHPDVEPGEARTIVLREGLRVREHPDLREDHLLVEGPADAAMRLANWDEVAYVFPASRELLDGAPVHACRGAVTAGGPVGQYIITVGPGWDGYGKGPATLTYSYQALSKKLPRPVVRRELERAMREWSKHVKVDFRGGGGVHATRNVNFLFATGNYGSPYPFDGRGRVLAQTFYPAPPNPEPIAGDVHFDDDEPWNIGVRIDLFSVAVHELGHALGLGHSDNPVDIMYPYYRMTTELAEGDIASIRQLYLSTEAEAPVAPLELAIQSPANPTETTAAWVRLTGTATGGLSPLRITWSSNRGGSGVAQGSETWLIPYVLLGWGKNVISIAVRDARGARLTRYVTVNRSEAGTPPPADPEPSEPADPPTAPADPPTPGSKDTAPPAIKVLSPATTLFATRSETIVLRGAATDNVGVSLVTWSSNTGLKGTARGTNFWRSEPIRLRRGMNIIIVHAHDAAGNHSWRAVMVNKR